MKDPSPTRWLSVICVLVLWFAASAADWPRWRGPENTGVAPAGSPVPASLPEDPKVLWRIAQGEAVGSPVVSGGRVFCLDKRKDKETLAAFDLTDGHELWAVAIDAVISDNMGTSPRGAPVADGDRVYVQSCRGELQCLGAADGKPIWRVNFVKDFGATFIGEKGDAAGASRHGYTGSPLVDGPRLLVGVGGRHGASVVCFDKLDGHVLWKSQDDVPGYAGPVVANVAGARQVLSFTAEGLIGLDASDGRLLWRVPIKTSYARHVTTPVALGDMVVVASHEAGLLGYRIVREGTELKAEKAWSSKDLAIDFSSPVLAGGHLYGLGPKKKLFCADLKTGKPAWTSNSVLGSPGTYASIVVVGDKLLVLGDGGRLSLLAADPAKCRTLGSAKVCGRNWCNPAYVDGKLVIRDREELLCVEVAR